MAFGTGTHPATKDEPLCPWSRFTGRIWQRNLVLDVWGLVQGVDASLYGISSTALVLGKFFSTWMMWQLV